MVTASVETKDVFLKPTSTDSHQYEIWWNERKVGFVHLKKISQLNLSVLDDVNEDEWETIIPVFENLQNADGWYLDEINIEEECQGKGIGKQVIGNLLFENRPVFLYSLADAEEFWERMQFEQVCGYYYVWQPEEVL